MNQHLDLVKIAENAKPPVCKIMNYGKFKFEQSKKEKESKKNQRIVDIKEVRLSLNIDSHDFDTKVGHARRFAEHGDKVKVSIRFKGRELSHPQLGYDLMSRFSKSCSEFATVERAAKLDGRSMLMFLTPSIKPKAAASEAPLENVQQVVNQESAPNEVQADQSITTAQTVELGVNLVPESSQNLDD